MTFRRVLLFLGLLTFSSAFSAEPDRLDALLKEALPPVLQNVVPGKTSREDLARALGSPMSRSKADEAFYQVLAKGADSNDLTVGLKAGKVSYFYYKLDADPKRPSLTLKSIRPMLPEKAIHEAFERSAKEATSPRGGTAIVVALPEKGLLLKFERSEDAPLRAVLSWKPGQKMP